MPTTSSTHRSLVQTFEDQPLSLNDRRQALLTLKQLLINNEERIFSALKKDLGRANFENYVAEIAMIKEEIDLAVKSLKSWTKKRNVKTPLVFQPGSSYIEPCPKGVILIIAPWNYPFQLSLVPLISAIAAGNAVMLKPSELAPTCALLIKELLDSLSLAHIKVICGNADTAKAMLELPFDHIFYTGSTEVGALVMAKAAKSLTPVTLELGGKSPCIIDESADLKLAAKRITWGKCLNAGQTCIAPDYVLIDRKLQDQFVSFAKEQLILMYGKHPQKSPDLGRIINERHFDRLVGYLKDGRIVHGGRFNKDERFIEPTILIDMDLDSALMKEEIFGPILPVVAVDNIDQAIQFIRKRPHPLALYLFAKDSRIIERVLKNTLSGGVSINDCLNHVGIAGLPFGGVRHSGIGSYHGVHGFNTFSHFRGVHHRSNMLDNPIKYPPYSPNKLKLVRIVM